MPKYLKVDVTGTKQVGVMTPKGISSKGNNNADLSQFMSRPEKSPNLVMVLIAASSERPVSPNSNIVSSA